MTLLSFIRRTPNPTDSPTDEPKSTDVPTCPPTKEIDSKDYTHTPTVEIDSEDCCSTHNKHCCAVNNKHNTRTRKLIRGANDKSETEEGDNTEFVMTGSRRKLTKNHL